MLSDWANLQLFFLKNLKKNRKCPAPSQDAASAGAARRRALRASRPCVLALFFLFFIFLRKLGQFGYKRILSFGSKDF